MQDKNNNIEYKIRSKEFLCYRGFKICIILIAINKKDMVLLANGYFRVYRKNYLFFLFII
ncbi:hypothetical protein [Helicobacter sp. MIT 14-3879]|uniref:hypothetical protein n=1 Tax=Helicobacter sp. MIT 14-3879 TaxID=2040649 RepID=UPI000E1F0690|nr:hypothetical protein [Helicobacter sp. MIT 14-3879]RDU63476.1 hypothetical protein CQA44_05140 [Helicobacter sp. MIT 14-3879]